MIALPQESLFYNHLWDKIVTCDDRPDRPDRPTASFFQKPFPAKNMRFQNWHEIKQSTICDLKKPIILCHTFLLHFHEIRFHQKRLSMRLFRCLILSHFSVTCFNYVTLFCHTFMSRIFTRNAFIWDFSQPNISPLPKAYG